jgi:hypothetical protein
MKIRWGGPCFGASGVLFFLKFGPLFLKPPKCLFLIKIIVWALERNQAHGNTNTNREVEKKVREGVKTGNEGIGSRGPRVNISLPIFFLSSPQLSGERLDASDDSSDDWSWRSNYLAYHSYVCRMI